VRTSVTAEKKKLAHGLMPSTITSQKDAKGLRRILKFVSFIVTFRIWFGIEKRAKL